MVSRMHGGTAPKRFWVLSALLPVLPDIDVIGLFFGFSVEDMLGHRGITHSVWFASMVGVLAVIIFFRNSGLTRKAMISLVAYFFFLTASHGFLDAFNDSNVGVAFWAPFENERYLFPFNPIVPSSVLLIDSSVLSVSLFFEKIYILLRSEILWIWVPLLALFGGNRLLLRLVKRGSS
jgi:inner membrane protein